MDFNQDVFHNPAAIEQMSAFNRVLPYEANGVEMEPALQYGSNNIPYVKIYAPNAGNVEFLYDENKKITLQKQPDGYWQAELSLKPGFYFVQMLIDGAALLTPMLAIGFGYSRPYNFLEIEPLEDYCRLKDIPHGSVTHEYYNSTATGSYETCLVYTPPKYSENNRSYPVLYLQHGHGENENCWIWQGKLNFILDNLIAEGKTVPMIVVMNNGMVQVKDSDGSTKVDHHAFENLLLNDVMPFIEQKYRVLGGRENHAMAGLSMGSMQTSIVSFRHPEVFAWIGLFSGFMHDLIAPDSEAHLKYLIDSPDSFNKNTRLFFRCIGSSDPFFANFAQDDIFCKNHGILCQRKEYEGKHDWNVWRKSIRDFAQMIFKE